MGVMDTGVEPRHIVPADFVDDSRRLSVYVREEKRRVRCVSEKRRGTPCVLRTCCVVYVREVKRREEKRRFTPVIWGGMCRVQRVA